MREAGISSQIKYITNAAGDPTEVIVPLGLWQQMLSQLRDDESGLYMVDEREPVAQLMADLRGSLEQSASQQTFPIDQLWDELED